MFSTDSSIPAFLDLGGWLRPYLNHLRHKCSCWKYCGIIVTKMFRLEILRHNCYKNVHVRNIVAQLLQNFRCCGDCGAVLGSISSKICAANPAMSNSIIWVTEPWSEKSSIWYSWNRRLRFNCLIQMEL